MEPLFFRVVTFCPRVYESAWSWSLPYGRRIKIYCECRSVVKLGDPGIYQLLSNRVSRREDEKEDDETSAACIEYLRTRRQRIHTIRLFPSISEPVVLNGVNGIRIGTEFFAHTQKICDVILDADLPEFSEQPPRPRVYNPGPEVYQRFEVG
jgi:hypothetical protein